MHAWSIDETKILSRNEITEVTADLDRKQRRSVNTRQNSVIFRLATCCGLRVSEIAGLKLADVRVGISKPYLNLPKRITKGKKQRRIPLWWDARTLAIIEAWKRERIDQGGKPGDFFVCSQAKSTHGKQLDRRNIRYRYISSCGILGQDRQAEITIHNGRHSFISHALAGGRSLAEVKQAAGHTSISTTSLYTHIAIDDDGQIGDLFNFEGYRQRR